MATRNNIEIAGLQLQYYCSRDTHLSPRCHPYFISKSPYQRFRLGERQVTFEGIFSGDRFRRPVGHHRTVVNAVRQFKETTAIAAELVFEGVKIKSSQVSDGNNTQFLQSVFRYSPYAGNTAHGERLKKRAHFVRLNHEESIRFAPI